MLRSAWDLHDFLGLELQSWVHVVSNHHVLTISGVLKCRDPYSLHGLNHKTCWPIFGASFPTKNGNASGLRLHLGPPTATMGGLAEYLRGAKRTAATGRLQASHEKSEKSEAKSAKSSKICGLQLQHVVYMWFIASTCGLYVVLRASWSPWGTSFLKQQLVLE